MFINLFGSPKPATADTYGVLDSLARFESFSRVPAPVLYRDQKLLQPSRSGFSRGREWSVIYSDRIVTVYGAQRFVDESAAATI